MARRFMLSVGWLTLARASLAISQVVVLPLFARLLEVEDFALMAIAMTVVIFTNILSDAGLGRSLIRSTGYDVEEWSSVFWFLAAFGLGLAAVVTAMAPLLAWVYGRDALFGMVAILATVPLLNAISAVPSAELERRERFGAIARVQMAATLGALTLAIAMAFLDYGVWALVAQQVAIAVITLVGLTALSRFRPGMGFARHHLREHLRFGTDTVAVSFLYTVQRQLPVLAMGRVLGETPLGLYAMNERVMRLPSFGIAGPVGRVVYVRMARAKDDPQKLADLYAAATRLLALIVIPPMAMLAVSAEASFAVALSDKWRDIGLIFALTAPAVAVETAVSGMGNLFMATGQTGLRVRMAAERALIALAMVLAAIPFGIAAVAFARSAFTVGYLARFWGWGRRCAPLDLRALTLGLLVPTAVTAPFALAHWILSGAYGLSDLQQLGLAMVGALVATAAALLCCRRTVKADLRAFRG
ncbi:MAG: lipopolysaccharide biosynthesis protein [Pseudomonadota bacterium]